MAAKQKEQEELKQLQEKEAEFLVGESSSVAINTFIIYLLAERAKCFACFGRGERTTRKETAAR